MSTLNDKMKEGRSIAETAEKKKEAMNTKDSNTDTKTMIKKVNKNKKLISASVDIKTYEKFTKINKARGLSNNSIIAAMISDYVAQYAYHLTNEKRKE